MLVVLKRAQCGVFGHLVTSLPTFMDRLLQSNFEIVFDISPSPAYIIASFFLFEFCLEFACV